MSDKPFLDSNILIYAFTTNDPRCGPADALVASGGIVSVQVLNEFVNVSRKKWRWLWKDIEAALDIFQVLLEPPKPLTIELHKVAVRLARDHKLPIYDSLIIASASLAKCRVLYTEDMQNGRTIVGVTIRNPFVSA